MATALILAASTAIFLSFWLPDHGHLDTVANHLKINPNPPPHSTEVPNLWLLALPTAVCLVIPLLLRRGGDRDRSAAIATGIVLAAGLWSWILCVRMFVPAMVLDGIARTISGTFTTALWLRLVAAVAFTAAGVVLVAREPDLSTRVRWRRDPRALLGAIVVFAGAMVLPASIHAVSVLIDRQGNAAWAPLAGAWAQVAMFWVVFIPLATLLFNAAQRRVALATTLAFTVFAGARAFSVSNLSDYKLSGTGAGVVMLLLLLVGVLIGQLNLTRRPDDSARAAEDAA